MLRTQRYQFLLIRQIAASSLKIELVISTVLESLVYFKTLSIELLNRVQEEELFTIFLLVEHFGVYGSCNCYPSFHEIGQTKIKKYPLLPSRFSAYSDRQATTKSKSALQLRNQFVDGATVVEGTNIYISVNGPYFFNAKIGFDDQYIKWFKY